MAHDVFVSHSSKDKVVADAIVACLEQNGLRCWYAPRDIFPGASWANAIIDAIVNSKLMVIVFSTSANASEHIRREVERAITHGVAVVPLRIEDVAPSGELEYFLGSSHWVDAITPPIEAHLQNLAQRLKRILPDTPSSTPAPHLTPAPPTPPSPPATPSATPTRRPLIFLAALLIFAAGIAAALLLRRSPPPSSATAGASTANDSLAAASEPRDPDQYLRLFEQIQVGHFLGLPELTASVEYTNPTSHTITFGEISVDLTAPSGALTHLSLIQIYAPAGPLPPFPAGDIKPGEKIPYHYDFFLHDPGYSGLQQRVGGEISGRVRPGDKPDPAAELLSAPLTTDLQAFARQHFIWAPGDWTLTIKCPRDNVVIERTARFHLTDADVQRMQSIITQYRSGIGVVLGWQFWQTGPEAPVVQLNLSPIPGK